MQFVSLVLVTGKVTATKSPEANVPVPVVRRICPETESQTCDVWQITVAPVPTTELEPSAKVAVPVPASEAKVAMPVSVREEMLTFPIKVVLGPLKIHADEPDS